MLMTTIPPYDHNTHNKDVSLHRLESKDHLINSPLIAEGVIPRKFCYDDASLSIIYRYLHGDCSLL